jgi:hypothetical protein
VFKAPLLHRRSNLLAPDVLASVIGHERGCDQAEHRANRNVCGDRK